MLSLQLVGDKILKSIADAVKFEVSFTSQSKGRKHNGKKKP